MHKNNDKYKNYAETYTDVLKCEIEIGIFINFKTSVLI